MTVYLTHYSTCCRIKKPEISERIIGEHTTATVPREVVLKFIDIVNTIVSSSISGNPISLRKKKSHLLSSLCMVEQLTKNKSSVPFCCHEIAEKYKCCG